MATKQTKNLKTGNQMKHSKAKAIFEENEKDAAEAYLDDVQLEHPRMKIFKLKFNYDDNGKEQKQGGYAIAGQFALSYKTRFRIGLSDWVQQ